MFTINDLPNELTLRSNAPLLTGILRGIEREALRVDHTGQFSLSPHPKGLGSALTHPMITTDFSETLLEFITPPTHTIDDLFLHLENIHRFALEKMPNEMLWTNSMPCLLPEDENSIPVAHYGTSNNGIMKKIYRLGLGQRYGRAMQTVAGVHYNFSLPNAFWAHFHAKENSLLSFEDYKNKRYFDLIRNFRRNYWLLILLFGASPALCQSFVGQRAHKLETFPGNKALYKPYATSLRMGDLGYQSHAQENLYVCYNEKDTYISTLSRAILTPYEAYSKQGIRNDTGDYRQLNDGLLQIENEFYSSIRPKRTAKPGETALTALKKRGVEYIEVRCLDVNPFNPVGISREQVAFLDVFLLHCALDNSPQADIDEFTALQNNQRAIVNQGRQPGLELEHPKHGKLTAATWGSALLSAMGPVAELLDKAHGCSGFSEAVATQANTLQDLNQTPSARILESLANSADGYSKISLNASLANHTALRDRPLESDTLKRYEDMAKQSVIEQKTMEENSTQSFDDFLNNYYKQYIKLL